MLNLIINTVYTSHSRLPRDREMSSRSNSSVPRTIVARKVKGIGPLARKQSSGTARPSHSPSLSLKFE